MLRKDTRIKNKSLLELKKRNINEIFKFDIIRDRTKMFVYRGERAEESIKAERERELVNDCDIHTDHMLDRFIDKGSGHKLNKLANAPKISIYSNFVQLLVEKRKKQRERSG